MEKRIETELKTCYENPNLITFNQLKKIIQDFFLTEIQYLIILVKCWKCYKFNDKTRNNRVIEQKTLVTYRGDDCFHFFLPRDPTFILFMVNFGFGRIIFVRTDSQNWFDWSFVKIGLFHGHDDFDLLIGQTDRHDVFFGLGLDRRNCI